MPILETNSVRKMAFESMCLWSGPSSPPKNLHSSNCVLYWPQSEFLSSCWLYPPLLPPHHKVFYPSFELQSFNFHRSAEFLCKSLRFLFHALSLFSRHIDSTVCLTCAVANFDKRAGPGGRKTNVRLCGERLCYASRLSSRLSFIFAPNFTLLTSCPPADSCPISRLAVQPSYFWWFPRPRLMERYAGSCQAKPFHAIVSYSQYVRLSFLYISHLTYLWIISCNAQRFIVELYYFSFDISR